MLIPYISRIQCTAVSYTHLFGAEVDKELRYNIKAKKFEETVTDPDSGKEKKVKSAVDVAAPSTNDYARFFDESCEAYESNMDYNLMYLRSQQNLANDKLKANGYLFLSDVDVYKRQA